MISVKAVSHVHTKKKNTCDSRFGFSCEQEFLLLFYAGVATTTSAYIARDRWTHDGGSVYKPCQSSIRSFDIFFTLFNTSLIRHLKWIQFLITGEFWQETTSFLSLGPEMKCSFCNCELRQQAIYRDYHLRVKLAYKVNVFYLFGHTQFLFQDKFS